jgi:hypothetical protein
MQEPLDPPYGDYVPRSEAESRFLRTLLSTDLGFDLWWGDYPWVTISLAENREGVWADHARLDYDGSSIKGGYDSSGLQDNGTPIEASAVDLGGPDGIVMTGTPEELAEAAATWFAEVAAKWRDGRRRKVIRWTR